MSAESELKDLLLTAILPGLEQSVGDIGRLKSLDIDGSSVRAVLELGLSFETVRNAWQESLVQALTEHPACDAAIVTLSSNIVAHGVQPNLKPLPSIRNVIAVASGKGGVGKSTTAVNLALALVADGAKVGILDADIYGPSQPLMLGLTGQRPLSEDGKSMQPLVGHGLEVMSIGFLVDQDQPMVWRGPMVTQALSQLLTQTRWSELDYLIVDMPPGTGDIQLTLSQKVPVSGAVIVTTPQDIALLDATKGLQMFRKVSVPVLGVIENMSTHICSECGHEEPLFGSGGGQRLAADSGVGLLGQLPLELGIRLQTDSGTPTVVADPGSNAAEAFRSTARRMAARLAMQGKDYSSKFPNIVVEDT